MDRNEYLDIRNNIQNGIDIQLFFEYYNGHNYNPKFDFTIDQFVNTFQAFARHTMGLTNITDRVLNYFDQKFNITSLCGTDGKVIKYM